MHDLEQYPHHPGAGRSQAPRPARRRRRQWLADEVPDSEHSDFAAIALVPEPRDQTRHGPRQGDAATSLHYAPFPQGQPGRPSKALTMAQAEALLRGAAHSRMHAYIVVSLLTGARTEELRALTWDHVDLDGEPTVACQCRRMSRCGGRFALVATPRPANPGGLSPCRNAAWTRCATCETGKIKSAKPRALAGRTTGSCSPLGTAPR